GRCEHPRRRHRRACAPACRRGEGRRERARGSRREAGRRSRSRRLRMPCPNGRRGGAGPHRGKPATRSVPTRMLRDRPGATLRETTRRPQCSRTSSGRPTDRDPPTPPSRTRRSSRRRATRSCSPSKARSTLWAAGAPAPPFSPTSPISRARSGRRSTRLATRASTPRSRQRHARPDRRPAPSPSSRRALTQTSSSSARAGILRSPAPCSAASRKGCSTRRRAPSSSFRLRPSPRGGVRRLQSPVREADSLALDATDVILRDGSTLRLRAPARTDAGALLSFFEGLSQRSLYLRFHGLPRRDRSLAEPYLDSDWRERGALVGVLDDRVVALANYVRLRDRTGAEAAFVVADELQGLGIGTRLLEQL